MQNLRINSVIALFILFNVSTSNAGEVYELDGSAFATHNAPMAEYIKSQREKIIMVNPKDHVWGAYNSNGKLIRWGIATAGSGKCMENNLSCKTVAGTFRVYLLGDEGCSSRKYPVPDGGAPMPYCMYFNGSEALHGSSDISYDNVSHGCVRIHIDDAKWLRYHFVEGPTASNHYRGTKIIIQSY